jgi:hypothetical protein
MRYYKYVNILSIDIAVGAMVCAWFFAQLFEATIRPYAIAALGLTVWIIYTTDHLMDAKIILGRARTDRHYFHQKYFSWLLIGLIVALVLDIIQLFYIRKALLENGVLLLVTVAVYFVIIRYVKIVKEVFITALYTAGVILPSLSAPSTHVSAEVWLGVFYFGTTALLNIIMFTWFDAPLDIEHGQSSFTTTVGLGTSKKIIDALVMLQLAFGVALTAWLPLKAALVLLAMNSVLSLIWWRRNHMKNNNLFRLWGDAVFLMPAIFVWGM